MKIKIKKLNEKACVSKAHESDAGWDLVATSKVVDTEAFNVVYGTGIAVEIPQGYVGLLFPRSSNANKALLLSNSVGVIDSGYRGEILAKFRMQVGVQENPYYKIGDRIAQLIVMPYPQVEWEFVNELSESDRGTGGYGSSGK